VSKSQYKQGLRRFVLSLFTLTALPSGLRKWNPDCYSYYTDDPLSFFCLCLIKNITSSLQICWAYIVTSSRLLQHNY